MKGVEIMIHVCYGLYDKFGRYSKFTGTSIQSLFANTKSEVTVHILHDNTLTEDNLRRFETLAKNFNRQINFYNVEKLCAEEIFKLQTELSAAAESVYSIGSLYRFLIPSLIDEEKIIYLDSDTVINLDIAELWQIELGERVLAVVPEKAMGVPTEIHLPLCVDKFVAAEDYFNSGVLLINLKRFRQETEKLQAAQKFIAQNPRYKYFDQDILNYCFSTQTIKLPNKFNLYVDYARGNEDIEVEEKICHYVGNAVDLNMRDKFSRLWMEYFLQTPFFDTETVLRLYDCIQNLDAQAKDKLIDVSRIFLGKRRIFYAELINFEGFRQIFGIGDDEKVIDGTQPDALEILLNEMKKFRGEVVGIFLSENYKAIMEVLQAEGFADGRDFINALHFLSSVHGRPVGTKLIIRAI